MKNVMAIVFAYQRNEEMKGLTHERSLPSVPIGGRYRIIDFQLSNLVNSGINKIGVITRNNYQSLMDHIGSGKEWDLNRKIDGLYVLPPFSYSTNNAGRTTNEIYRGKMEALVYAESFIRRSNQEYVVLCNSDHVANIQLDEMFDYHMKKGADITIMYKRGPFNADDLPKENNCFLELDADNRVKKLDADTDCAGENLSIGTMIISKSLLEALIWEANNNNAYRLHRDVLAKKVDALKIYGFEFTKYYRNIHSIPSYFKANMELLNDDIRNELFYGSRRIYTKTRDENPAVYCPGAKATNTLAADGCIIEGTVENSILFRGVKVRSGAVVKNCIIMQDCEIQSGAELEYIICDKGVVVRENSKLIRHEIYPMVVAKGTVV